MTLVLPPLLWTSSVDHCWTSFHAELEKVGKFHEQLASKADELVLTIDTWIKEKEKIKLKARASFRLCAPKAERVARVGLTRVSSSRRHSSAKMVQS